MDPRTEECYGFYLYGSGHESARENTLGIATGSGIGQRRHFCMGCRVRESCEAAQHKRVAERQPEAAEDYDRALREALDSGFTELLASMALAQSGANPYYNDAMESFRRAHADRGHITAADLR